MATTRTRRHLRPVPALQWLWAVVLSLLFIVAGVALVAGGVLFAVVGVRVVLDPQDAGHAIAGVLFVGVGLAGVAGGVLTIWWLLPRAVKRLSGRKPPSLSGGSGGGFYGGYFGGGDGGCGGDGGRGSC